MNVYKQRVLNLVRGLRESPAPNCFTMRVFFNKCGTPACVFGHYVARPDLQDQFRRSGWDILGKRGPTWYDSLEVAEHFGIMQSECWSLFSSLEGCGGAKTADEAIAYIESFAARKWPEPKRTDSELVADLMARVCGERIPEEVT